MSSREQNRFQQYLIDRPALFSAITEVAAYIPISTHECVCGDMKQQYDTAYQLAEVNALTEFFGLIPEDTWIRPDLKDEKTKTVFMGVDGTTGMKGVAFGYCRRARTTSIDVYFVRHDGENITERGRGIGWEKSWKISLAQGLEPQMNRRCITFAEGEKLVYPSSVARIPIEAFDSLRRSISRTHESLSRLQKVYAFALAPVMVAQQI